MPVATPPTLLRRAIALPALLMPMLMLIVLLTLARPAAAAATTHAGQAPSALQLELDRFAAKFDGTVGLYALDLRTGRSAVLNPADAFPMASTVKIPVAVHILSLVDEGRLDLHRQVQLQEGDLYPSMGGPMDTHLTPGSAITIRDLLHMMLTVSDNNATDILIRLGGGAAAVNQRMQTLGVQGVRVDRYIWEMLSHYLGRLDASPTHPVTPAAYAQLDAEHRSAEERTRLTRLYHQDPRDTSTPQGMAALLKLIWQGKALTPASTEVLKAILLDCRTGQARLKGMLPDGTPVAHKTGTVGEVINDVGVMTLPDGRGDIIITVFLKSGESDQARDRVIAQMARSVYDYFRFVP
ncbi:class A beta-lactamase [Pseudoxanthomonas indica]|uniref:beta-lactamase n=1 Tax=Pseudoxanthomonas indica TaxID=428993 RepID=A0A1T5KC02_9GAMM|nr:class A beta-lactamase [Pseudoxanthomonas indica]GGD48320.1 beta-lactamase [Pseudoxanthomonas indica]SKC61174.1 beta-lactamase class A [Pseudoxanthomonas indica]